MILAEVTIGGKAVLAPLAGISDFPFRKLCKSHGAALVFTEMVSAEGLLRHSARTEKFLFFKDEERPVGVQLFGSAPEVIAVAAQKVARYKPDFLDLNFGCPVRKVIRQGAGAALLQDLDKLGRVCRAAVEATPIPVTAKIRSGWATEIACEIASVLADNGAAAITVHARTRKAQFSGSADWRVIEKVKKAVSVPVIGNGDVRDAFDAKRMFEETGCDLIMIGRAALGNPFIFREINGYLQDGTVIAPATAEERIRTCIEHYDEALKLDVSAGTVQKMRKHIGWYLKGLPEVRALRKEIFALKTAGEVRARLVTLRDSLN